jgi:molybdopterin-synthase adenylyltransferase
MNDNQLQRYSRHILLTEVGIEGQERLLSSHALIIGAGGLGCAAGLYLASAGIGYITVVDDDTVELTNLQRQIAHNTQRLGQLKVQSMAQSLKALNPEIRITALAERANAQLLNTWVAKAHIVLDCSDNFATRHIINQACVKHRKPLVSGAAIGFDGQVAVFNAPINSTHSTPNVSSDSRGPCYACLFPAEHSPQETRCATMGVWAPLVGIIGSVQAAEALKLLAAVGTSLSGRVQLLNAKTMQWTELQLARQAQCQVCATS